MALTEKTLLALKPKDKNYRVADGHGLVVEITTTGYKSFRYRYRYRGQLKMLVLGRYPDMKLAEARTRAAEARDQLDKGTDPGAAKQQEKRRQALGAEVTFRAVCEEWHGKAKARLSEAAITKHQMFLDGDIYPVLGDTPVAEVAAADVLRLLRRVEARGAFDIAKRSYSLVGRAMRYAVALGLTDRDPTRDITLRDVLHPPATRHHAAVVEPVKFGELLRSVDGYTGSLQIRIGLQLAPLVFVRAGELRHAEWREFSLDGDDPVWRIPAEKTKMKTPHIVHLAPQAVALIRQLLPLTGAGRYLFSTAPDRGRPASENSLNAALRRLGWSKEEATFHGFRSSASTMLHELGYPRQPVGGQGQRLTAPQDAESSAPGAGRRGI
jgi:integrase